MGTDSKSINERGPSLVLGWFRWACPTSTRDFWSALAALVSPVQNIFFLTAHFYYSFVPIARQAGQAAVLGRLSLSFVSLESTINITVCKTIPS
jgi:hypothetical protein